MVKVFPSLPKYQLETSLEVHSQPASVNESQVGQVICLDVRW